MEKRGGKYLFAIAMILIALILLGFFYSQGNSFFKKDNFLPTSSGTVCSSKCYINKLLGDTQITNKPILDIWATLGPHAYNNTLVINRNRLPLNISTLNIGKTEIPYAEIYLVDAIPFQRVSGSWIISNLPAMESRENTIIDFSFKLRDDFPSIRNGKYNLKFRVICPICKEQVYYKYITICVYETDPVEDCGGIWWYIPPYL